MSNSLAQQKKHPRQYAKLFSSLFCSMSTLTLSVLCLLNSMSLDLYSTTTLLMVVVPGAASFWVIGFIMGKIFDTDHVAAVKKQKNKEVDDEKAYEIPSMFSSMDNVGAIDDDIFGDL